MDLFREYLRLLAGFRPLAFVVENVRGLVLGKMRLRFREMLEDLRACGYRVACRMLNAWWYGVPQDRRRLIWIGLRDDLHLEASHPPPTRGRPMGVVAALDADGIADGTIRNVMHHNAFRSARLPAPTLLAQKPPVVRYPGCAPRPLSIREAKRLHGFPDSFDLREGEYRLIGNSVPPPMAEAIGRHIISLLAGFDVCEKP